MAYVLLGILGIALLASFVAAYLGAKTWPIYQVVLVVFVFMGLLAFFYLGARTLATHRAWRNLVEQQKKELAQLTSQIVPLTGGVDASGHSVRGSIPQLKHELQLLTSARSGVYYNAAADSIKDGVVQLTLQPPSLPTAPADPNAAEAPAEAPPAEPPAEKPADAPAFAHGLAANTVLYVFDQKPLAEGGRYLGEFKVVAAPEKSPAVQVQANLPMTAAQAKRVEAAVKGTWTLYTTMPVDEAAPFVAMDEARRKALLPADLVEEYAKADRPLRDYQAFFQQNYVQRSLLADAISRTTTNIERIEATTQEVAREIGYRETEKTNLASDLERFQFEVKAIAAYETAVETPLAGVLAQLRATYLENRRAALALEQHQLERADEINRRTSAVQPSR